MSRTIVWVQSLVSVASHVALFTPPILCSGSGAHTLSLNGTYGAPYGVAAAFPPGLALDYGPSTPRPTAASSQVIRCGLRRVITCGRIGGT